MNEDAEICPGSFMFIYQFIDDLSEGLTLAIFNGGGGVGQKSNVSIGGQ